MSDALLPVDAGETSHPVPFTRWWDFYAAFDWQQGEHVTVIGPTGTGKTTVLRAIMPKRYAAHGAVAVLATKSMDENLEKWARADHMTVTDQWPPRPPQTWKSLWTQPAPIEGDDGHLTPWDQRVMVWPRAQGMELRNLGDHFAETHRRAMTDMFWQGGWCVVAEELWHLTKLGLAEELSQIWTQGRSAGLSLVGATQRPVEIPLFAYSQPTHLFVFGDNDERNLDRLSGIGGMSGNVLRGAVKSLRGHDVLYINTRTRELVRTRVPVRKR